MKSNVVKGRPMAVISLASPKGGCGKSTTAIVLAGTFATQGYRVRIIDADPARRVLRWAEAGLAGDAITVAPADAKTLVQAVRDGEAEAEIVLIDVEGSASMVQPIAIGHSNFVLIPANPSAADVEEAVATVQLIADTPTKAGTHAPFGLVWTRFPTGFISRDEAALIEQIAGAGVPIMGRLYERPAYRSLISFSTTLDKLPTTEIRAETLAKAIAEGEELAGSVANAILKQSEKAA